MHVADLFYLAGGAENHLRRLLPALRDIAEPWMVYGVQTPENFAIPGIEQRFIDFSQSTRDVADQLHALVEYTRPDIIHLHNLGAANDIFRYLQPARLPPIFVSFHVQAYFCPGQLRFWGRTGEVCPRAFGPMCLPIMYLKRCMSYRPSLVWVGYQRAAHAVPFARRWATCHVTSRYMEACLLENGIAPKDIVRLPYFVDLPAATLPCDSNTLLFCGRLTPTKGVDVLLRALSQMSNPAELVIVGDGHARGELELLARDLGLERQVQFVGWVSDPEPYYRAARCVIVPSVWPEPFGIVGIEALSHQRPVIGSNIGGIPDWCRDGETGFLVTPGDPSQLAERMDRVLMDTVLARRLGAQGRELVRHEFSAERHIAGLVQAYEGSIERRAAVRLGGRR